MAIGVSPTAIMLAAARAAASRDAALGVYDPFAHRLVDAAGIEFFNRLANGDIDISTGDEVVRCTRRMVNVIGKHTLLFDQFHKDAVQSGIRQTVILAAGLDARAYRLPWLDGISVFEIDEPDTVAFKHNALWNMRVPAIAEVRLVGCGLRQDWKSALLRTSFQPDQPTAWIFEGLFGHLPTKSRLLADVTSLSASGSWFAADDVPRLSTRQQRRLRDSTQRLLATWKSCGLTEEIDDIVVHQGRSGLADALKQHGWQVVTSSTSERPRVDGPVPVASKEDGYQSCIAIEYVTAIRR
jgi:methyltransferase (TIGR00027 family)